jgi:hypothetical protein
MTKIAQVVGHIQELIKQQAAQIDRLARENKRFAAIRRLLA